MFDTLPSYLADTWCRGSGEPVIIHDAVTGDVVTGVDSTGLDLASAVDYARRVGGAGLRDLGSPSEPASSRA